MRERGKRGREDSNERAAAFECLREMAMYICAVVRFSLRLWRFPAVRSMVKGPKMDG